MKYVRTNASKLYFALDPYIREHNLMVTDGKNGIIDFCHMAATMSAYFGGIPSNFWASWGGDLATGMADTTKRISDRDKGDGYWGMTDQEIAEMTIGGDSSCSYNDFCSDFDAYKVQEKVHALLDQTETSHPLSDALEWYYNGNIFQQRFKWLAEELNCSLNVRDLYQAILKAMTGVDEQAPGFGLLASQGKKPSREVIEYCCKSFANYIYSMNL